MNRLKSSHALELQKLGWLLFQPSIKTLMAMQRKTMMSTALQLLAIAIIYCLTTPGLHAQSTSRPWHIYLKDGNFLRATVLDTLADGQLRIRSTPESEAILLAPTLVQRIKRSPKGSILGINGRTVQAEGWYCSFQEPS